MKLISTILIAVCLHVSTRGFAQNVTLKVNNVPLTVALAKLQKQTSYYFAYSDQTSKSTERVSANMENMPLNKVLDAILKNLRLTYAYKGKYIIISPIAASPDLKTGEDAGSTRIDIKGRVVNEKGDPVIATIMVKGTTTAVSSNANGEFVLARVDKNGILLITGINMEAQEIKVNGNVDLKTITVKTKIKEEEEVVIANTGYQKVKPNEITGSVSVIDNKTLNQQTGTNIIDRLNGVTPGMLFNVGKLGTVDNPNPNPYSIRGLSTIEGNTSPLIILDNFPYDGDINNINPGDVDNITILKDAAAASIYGARGGNGVIVITTKRGRFNQKLKVEFNADMIVTQKPDLYAIPQLSSADYIYLEEFFYKNGFDFNARSTPYSPITPVLNILIKRGDKLISAADSANQIDALKQVDSREDLNKYFYQNAITRQYSLNLRGGSNNLAWLLSGSYDKSIISLDGKADKINIKLNNEYKPLKNLNISFSVYYTSASTETGKKVPDPYRKVPYLKYVDAEGTPLSVNTRRDLFFDTVGDGHLLNWKYFPLEDYKHDKTTTHREQLVAGVETRYTILRGLDLNLSYQYQREWGNSERYADLESYAARDNINNFTKLSRTSAPDTFYMPKGGFLQVQNSSENSYNLRAQLGFQKDWQQRRHAVNAIIAAERREAVINPINQYILYGYSKDPLTQGRVNYEMAYPDFRTGQGSYIQGAPVTSPARNSRFISILGNITYTFKERYFLSASARKDAANVFGLSTNNKWTPLWSAGVAWDMSKEPFYQFPFLPYLKWRFTYGYSGNVDASKTALTIITYNNSFPTPYATNYADASRPNPDLRWEKKQDFNIAMEFATKDRRISGSIEYYQKKCTDLYGQTLYDYTTYAPLRFRTIPANVANTKGNGIDISVTSKNSDKKIKWNTTLIFNYSRDIVTDYFSPSAQSGGGLVSNTGNNIFPVIGKPLYAIAAYRWGGLDSVGNPQGYYQGKLYTDYLGIRGDVQINGLNSTSVSYMGPSNPPFFGSLINEISWKGFSLNVNLLYSFGYYFRKPIFSQVAWQSDGTGYGEFSRRWQRPGDELITNVPALLPPFTTGVDSRTDFYQYSSVNVLKADHIRLHYINLSYSFARKYQRFPFSFMQAYFNVANLGVIWRANNQKIDPLYPNSIPPSKSFTIGVRASL